MKRFFRILCDKWKKIAYTIGVFNSRVILTLIYIFLLWPFVIFFRVKETLTRNEKVNSNWEKIKTFTKTLSEAKEQ